MKKIIRTEGPAKKITLLRYCPKKNFWPRHKSQPPPPEYQMDRALTFIQTLKTPIQTRGNSIISFLTMQVNEVLK